MNRTITATIAFGISSIYLLCSSVHGDQPKESESNYLANLVTLTPPYPQSYKGAETDRISVQYAVIEICRQVGLGYNWQQSYKNTDPLCRRWIYPAIKNKSFSRAIKEILSPLDLDFEIVDGKVVLKKATSTDQGEQASDIPITPANGDKNKAYVIRTVPANGNKNVNAQKTTEIVVTYNKEIMSGCCSWCTAREGEYPKTTGKPIWPSDKRTCILPVKLEANKTYAIWLNIAERYTNFKDKDGQPAIPYLLIFRTVE